mmetsp:Transcript_45774/g.71725  ORF Transcript_45774/g.71725 Transcript_45774/m.71725 type:complete len:335 (+) Transcript_45774:199-1203(+)
MLTSYSRILGKNFKQGLPKSVELSGSTGVVTLADGELIPFDILVICTGATWSDSFISGLHNTETARLQNMYDTTSRIQKAASVTIVGGGVVGVELAGEIITEYPGKTVTLVHSRDRLVEYAAEKLGKAAEEILTRKGARVILGQRAEFDANGNPTKTESGEDIAAECSFICTGQKPNTEFLNTGEMASSLSQSGHVLINDQLQVIQGDKVLENVFSLGDCASYKGFRSGKAAREQADVAIKNLIAAVRGQAITGTWRDGPAPLVMSIGRDDGVLMLHNGWVMRGLPVVLGKSAREGGMLLGAWAVRSLVLPILGPWRPEKEIWEAANVNSSTPQ